MLKEHGLKVSNLYISQVKRKCGIEVGENYNLPKSKDSRHPQCPKEKEKEKAGYDDIAEQIESKKAKRELFKGFIRTLEKQDGLIEEFDAVIWSSLVQEVIVKAKDDIRFIFKNGFEVRV